MQDTIIRIAIQKSGRLSEDSVSLIQEAGIYYNQPKNRLRCEASNFPMEILFLRDDDIPEYVADGVADIGIVGENVVAEKEANVKRIEKLGFGKCRLSIAVPRSSDIADVSDLEGLDIATSYPNLLNAYLARQGVSAHIHEISGSVEIAPSIGLAGAICDLVSSGSTLISNGLTELQSIFTSEAVLISSVDLADDKTKVLDSFLFRIRSVLRARASKYILLNVPNRSIETVVELLPGMKSPTIMPLAREGWSSLHSVVNENEFWKVIEKLKEAGAEGILVIPIEKMVL